MADVMEKSLPKKFKIPQITLYSSKDNSYDLVQNYESLMMLHGWDPLTLVVHARAWFNSLPEASISSFGQLRVECYNYIAMTPHTKRG